LTKPVTGFARAVSALSISLVVVGCASEETIAKAKNMQILVEHPSRAYVVVKELDSHSISTDTHPAGEEDSLAWMRTQAAKSGADAIVDVTRDIYVLGGIARAIKFGSNEWNQGPAQSRIQVNGSMANRLGPIVGNFYHAYAIKYQ
jgi:hypothetical protein